MNYFNVYLWFFCLFVSIQAVVVVWLCLSVCLRRDVPYNYDFVCLRPSGARHWVCRGRALKGHLGQFVFSFVFFISLCLSSFVFSAWLWLCLFASLWRQAVSIKGARFKGHLGNMSFLLCLCLSWLCLSPASVCLSLWRQAASMQGALSRDALGNLSFLLCFSLLCVFFRLCLSPALDYDCVCLHVSRARQWVCRGRFKGTPWTICLFFCVFHYPVFIFVCVCLQQWLWLCLFASHWSQAVSMQGARF